MHLHLIFEFLTNTKDAKKIQTANCNGASKVIPNTFLKRKLKIILLVSGCILFAFFWHFSSLTTISLIKKKAMDIQGGLRPKKRRKRKKKTWNAIFFMDNLPVLRIFFAILREKDFSKTKSLFSQLFITVLFSVHTLLVMIIIMVSSQ